MTEARELDPERAMLLSTVFPGGGQLYARAYGSAVLIWATLALLGWLAWAAWRNLTSLNRPIYDYRFESAKQEALEQEAAITGWVLFGLVVLILTTWIAGAYDARKMARKYNARRLPPDGPDTAFLPVAPEARAPAQGRTAFCIQCGKGVFPDARFCGNCGASIPHP